VIHITHTEILPEEADIKNVSHFTGSLTGVGETVGDLTEPLEDEWETD